MTRAYDKSNESRPAAMRRAACPCRLCLALDEADAWIADHGGRPAQAARHLTRQSPGLLEPGRLLIALKKRSSL